MDAVIIIVSMREIIFIAFANITKYQCNLVAKLLRAVRTNSFVNYIRTGGFEPGGNLRFQYF